jgi:hypothetical protein
MMERMKSEKKVIDEKEKEEREQEQKNEVEREFLFF